MGFLQKHGLIVIWLIWLLNGGFLRILHRIFNWRFVESTLEVVRDNTHLFNNRVVVAGYPYPPKATQLESLIENEALCEVTVSFATQSSLLARSVLNDQLTHILLLCAKPHLHRRYFLLKCQLQRAGVGARVYGLHFADLLKRQDIFKSLSFEVPPPKVKLEPCD